MDQASSRGSSEMLNHVDKGVCENLRHLVEEGLATDRLGDRVILCGPSEAICNDLRLNNKLKEGPQEVKGEDIGDPPKINDTLREVDQGTSSNSSNSVDGEVHETCVVIDSSAQIEHVNGDSKQSEAKGTNESELSKLSIKAPKGVSEVDKNACVIDMNCGSYKGFSENLEGETICRICHLAAEQPLEVASVEIPNSPSHGIGLIMLGCACKDELGIAHSHCAEAWFKIKGNRLCEICSETAKNVPDVIGNGFMEDWSESGFMENDRTASSRRVVRCCSGQPFCNFLMACLVIAFVLPWFFRVKMF